MSNKFRLIFDCINFGNTILVIIFTIGFFYMMVVNSELKTSSYENENKIQTLQYQKDSLIHRCDSLDLDLSRIQIELLKIQLNNNQ